MSDYTTLGKFECTNDDYNTLRVYDNEGQISICCANYDGEYAEAYLSAEDEEKLRVLLNKRENKDG